MPGSGLTIEQDEDQGLLSNINVIDNLEPNGNKTGHNRIRNVFPVQKVTV